MSLLSSISKELTQGDLLNSFRRRKKVFDVDPKTLFRATKRKGKDASEEPEILRGAYMFPNGDKYDGEYSQNADGTPERSGTGTHTTADGTVYTGTWTGDKMNGTGKMEFPTGAFYEGEFVNNKFHGEGKYAWPNGSFYEGKFVDNKLEGDGNFTDTEGQTWQGMFRYKAALGLRFKVNLEV